jgi:hypothetical protein
LSSEREVLRACGFAGRKGSGPVLMVVVVVVIVVVKTLEWGRVRELVARLEAVDGDEDESDVVWGVCIETRVCPLPRRWNIERMSFVTGETSSRENSAGRVAILTR